MSEEPTAGITPRDRDAEASRQVRRRRRRIAAAVVVVLVAAVGIAELTGGLVSRAIDATGWTCGNGWSRIDDDDLAEMRIIRWGTPELREQDLDPADFTDMPPGLAEPSLTTAAFPADGDYDPLLYPLDGGVVLQSSGYYDQSWVAADAQSGEPLWGVASDDIGISTVQGHVALLTGTDGRTDITTLDPRTGEELSCLQLEGKVLDIDDVGEGDLVVALSIDAAEGDEDQSGYRLARLDPVAGETLWTQPINTYPATVHTEGELITVSSEQVGSITTRWMGSGSQENVILGIDAQTGQEVWNHRSPTGQAAALEAVPLPDGGTGTLALEIADKQAWDEARGEYVLLDENGEVLWTTPATYRRDSSAAWAAAGVAVVLENFHPVGLDLRTGERLWEAEGGGLEDDVALLDSGEGAVVVIADQLVDEDGDKSFVTHVVDARTGALTVYEVPLRSFRVTDSYVLSSTGQTQIVIPLAE